MFVLFFFFFFQAEDGIRDGRVTGVQTCALPICYSIRAMPKLLSLSIEATASSSIVSACARYGIRSKPKTPLRTYSPAYSAKSIPFEANQRFHRGSTAWQRTSFLCASAGTNIGGFL